MFWPRSCNSSTWAAYFNATLVDEVIYASSLPTNRITVESLQAKLPSEMSTKVLNVSIDVLSLIDVRRGLMLVFNHRPSVEAVTQFANFVKTVYEKRKQFYRANNISKSSSPLVGNRPPT